MQAPGLESKTCNANLIIYRIDYSGQIEVRSRICLVIKHMHGFFISVSEFENFRKHRHEKPQIPADQNLRLLSH